MPAVRVPFCSCMRRPHPPRALLPCEGGACMHAAGSRHAAAATTMQCIEPSNESDAPGLCTPRWPWCSKRRRRCAPSAPSARPLPAAPSTAPPATPFAPTAPPTTPPPESAVSGQGACIASACIVHALRAHAECIRLPMLYPPRLTHACTPTHTRTHISIAVHSGAQGQLLGFHRGGGAALPGRHLLRHRAPHRPGLYLHRLPPQHGLACWIHQPGPVRVCVLP